MVSMGCLVLFLFGGIPSSWLLAGMTCASKPWTIVLLSLTLTRFSCVDKLKRAREGGWRA
jgi:hypothetical protein